MHARTVSISLLATALGGLLSFGASAQTDDRATKEKELEAARAELQAAARRVASLSRELGAPNEGVFVFEERALRKPVLGVVLEADPSAGVRVSGVTPGSGAAFAGMRSGDRIVSVDGKPVTGADPAGRLGSLRKQLADLKAGTAVRIGYERDGKAASAQVVPQDAPPLMLFRGDGSESHAEGNVRFFRGASGDPAVEAQRFTMRPAPGKPTVIERRDENGRIVEHRVIRTAPDPAAMPGVSPEVHREIIRLGRDPGCRDGGECRAFALTEAFRWNGLNLASLDPQLGRYFGSSDGVLVVSAGPELQGLQSGDVIRRVDGTDVKSPREVMDLLRAKADGAKVGIDYLRDRKAGSTQITAPKAMRLPLPPVAPLPPPPPPAAPHVPAPPPPPPANGAPGLSMLVAPPPPPHPVSGRVD